MVNAVNVPSQTVVTNGAVLFGSTRIMTGCSVRHEQGSSKFIAKCPGVYKIAFSANVSAATITSPISLSIVQDGEVVAGSTMTFIPTAANTPANVAETILVQVYCDCCSAIGVRNTGVNAIQLDNANLVITRES